MTSLPKSAAMRVWLWSQVGMRAESLEVATKVVRDVAADGVGRCRVRVSELMKSFSTKQLSGSAPLGLLWLVGEVMESRGRRSYLSGSSPRRS